jgi:hypothetical protein
VTNPVSGDRPVTARAKTPEPGSTPDVSADFSLTLGGPLYQLFLRLRIARPPLQLLRRRTIGVAVIAWLPLLLLSMLEGRAFGGVTLPFIHDIEAHVRYLVSLPLLIMAELIVHLRMRPLVAQFVERGLVAGEARGRFDAIVASVMRLRNSVVLEVLMLALVYSVGHYYWRQQHALPNATWLGSPTGSGLTLTWAGFWAGWVSTPLFQFLLLRWYFRLFLWWRFLWQVSRLSLRLFPTHPDRAGGLGFLADSALALAPLLLAQSALLSGVIAQRILFQGASLLDFKQEIIGAAVVLMLLVLSPLLFFVGQLNRVRRRGIQEYGVLASRYVADFDRKWLRGGAPGDEPLVGTADLQSLADLAGSLEVIETMRPVPFGKEIFVQIAAVVVLPLLPLLLTMFRVDELLGKLVGILL